MDKRHTRISKYLSLVLRHKPEEIGLRLDPQGWMAIDELLAAAAAHGQAIARHELDFVVANNNKKRFALSEDGLCIRADETVRAGFSFWVSDNGVWLTDTVPPRYIDEPRHP